MRTRLPCMNEQALPVGWVVKSIFLRQGPSTPSFEIFDVTYPDPADAVEGVRRVCGDDRHRIIEVAEELVATDLGQIVPDPNAPAAAAVKGSSIFLQGCTNTQEWRGRLPPRNRFAACSCAARPFLPSTLPAILSEQSGRRHRAWVAPA